MMTSEQIQQLRRAEAAMMTEWSASSVQLCCFNADGIVDYERWAALPDGKHIVVLLKETNALSGSLVDFLSHGGSETYYRTWNNVARWANMILNGAYWEFVPKSALDDMVRNIAVINLKKCSGRARASAKTVRQAARQDANRLKRQIQLSEKETLVVSMPHPNRAAKCWTLELEKILPSQPRRLRSRRKGPKPGKEGFFTPLYFV